MWGLHMQIQILLGWGRKAGQAEANPTWVNSGEDWILECASSGFWRQSPGPAVWGTRGPLAVHLQLSLTWLDVKLF